MNLGSFGISENIVEEGFLSRWCLHETMKSRGFFISWKEESRVHMRSE